MLPSPPYLKPDYGLHAPILLRFLAWGSLTLLLLAAVTWLFRDTFSPLSSILFHITLWSGLALLAVALFLLYANKFGQFRYRDRFVAALNLHGHERVLDVGCGRGLILLGMAKKLTTGRAVGIDAWQSADRSDNDITTTEENARRENVADRVELHTGDLRHLPFPDHYFDVVVSSQVLHKRFDDTNRRQVLQEIARVLKPDGQLVIAGISNSREYNPLLQNLGFAQLRRQGPRWRSGIPSYVLWGWKSNPNDHNAATEK